MSISPNRSTLFAILLFVIIGSLVYSNTLHVPFLFDDARNIQHPELMLEEISAEAVVGAVFGGELRERPVANLSFALNYFIHGPDVPGYHVVNIALHILAAFFLYLFFQQTLRLPVNQSRFGEKRWIVALIALIWLVHPLATQSVTYIVQRMNVLAALFYIVSFYCYVRGRNRQTTALSKKGEHHSWVWFVGCVVFGLLAIGSKEIALTLPFFLFLYEWFFFQDLSRRWLKIKIPWLLGLVVCGGVLVFVYLDGHPVNYILNGCGSRDFTMQERLLTQPRVIWHYISLLLYPHPGQLIFDYNFPVSTSFLYPITTIPAIAGLLLILLAAMFFAAKERLLAFSLIFFLGNLVIESSFICLEMIFDHRTYLPSTFFILFCVLLLCRLLRNSFAITGFLLLVICVFGFWTNSRNVIWQDPITFWQDSVDKQPGKARSHYNLGRSFYLRDDLEQAERSLEHALQLDSSHPLAQNNYGLVLFKTGRIVAAEEHFLEAIRLLPNYVGAYNNLAAVLIAGGRFEEALEQYRKILNVASQYAAINTNMGRLLLQMGRVGEALPLLEKAQVENPEQIELLLDIGEVLIRLDRGEEALAVYRNVLELDDSQVPAHFNLALIHNRLGHLEQALYHYDMTIQLKPEYVPALFNLGNLFLRIGRFAEAAAKYREVVRVAPQHAGAHNNLGSVLARLGDLQGAASAFTEAVRLNPSDKQATKNLEQVLKVIDSSGQPSSTDEGV